MSPKPVVAFRQRLLEDMAVRHFSEKSTHDYLRHIDRFLAFLGRAPETATADDLRDFQVQLNQDGVRPASFNSAVSALRFFFCTTLGQPGLGHQLARVHYPRKLPRVLSPEDVMRLLEAAPGPGLKYKAALSVAYGAGLRALEVCMLRVSDIDSKRMLIRVELGKGGKDRFAMLSPQLLELLRAWWHQCRSKG
jgi:site-specific recombinase XerD